MASDGKAQRPEASAEAPLGRSEPIPTPEGQGGGDTACPWCGAATQVEPWASLHVAKCTCGFTVTINVPGGTVEAVAAYKRLLSSPRVEEEEKAHGETIDERDALEAFIAALYRDVTGNECIWSNHFGLPEIRDEIIAATRVEEVRREALEEAAKVADSVIADIKRSHAIGLWDIDLSGITKVIRALSLQVG